MDSHTEIGATPHDRYSESLETNSIEGRGNVSIGVILIFLT